MASCPSALVVPAPGARPSLGAWATSHAILALGLRQPPIIPVFQTVILPASPPVMRSIHLYKWHLRVWIERITGGSRQNNGLVNRDYGGAALGLRRE